MYGCVGGAAEDGGEEIVLGLWVGDIAGVVGGGLLTEGEAALSNIVAIIVVEGGGADMLVL